MEKSISSMSHSTQRKLFGTVINGAISTDLESPETVEHLCGKCRKYANKWQPTADCLWNNRDR